MWLIVIKKFGVNFKVKIKLNSFYFILLIPIILLVGMRGATPDTQVYFNIFKYIDSYNLYSYKDFYVDSQVELGWGWYSKIISYFTKSSAILFSVFSFFIFWLIYRSDNILKLSFIHTLAFYIPSTFFLMQQFMQVRQGLATPSVILASLLFIDNRKKESIFFFIIALLFHQSTIAYILVFAVYIIFEKYYYKISKVNFFRIFNLLVLILGFFVAKLIVFPIAFSVFDRLNDYSGSVYAEANDIFSLSNIKFYLEFILILTLTTKKLLNNKFYVFMVFMFTVGLTIRLAFYDFGILGGRLSVVFLFIEIFLIPLLLYTRFSRLYFYTFLLIYFIVIFYVTWYFQVAQYLQNSYFIPLS